MTLYEFLLPLLLAVPVGLGIVWIRREARKLDRDRRVHPAE